MGELKLPYFPIHKAHQLTWVIANKALVEVTQLIGRNVAAGVIRGFEVQVVFAIAVELRCCHVHANDNLLSVAGFVDGFLEKFQSWDGERDRMRFSHC